MTDERTTTEASTGSTGTAEETGRTADASGTGTTVEGVATPVEDAPPSDSGDVDALATARRMASRFRPRRAAAALRPSGGRSEARIERALRLVVSLTAVVGYVLLFGAAIGAAGAALGSARAPFGALVPRFLFGGALLVPTATFLYVALYDDADLTGPRWSEGHPPLADAWLLVLAAVGAMTIALPGTVPGQFHVLGWAAATVAAYLATPLWLARRCLRRPSWTLGALAVVLAPLVLASAVVVTEVLGLPPDAPWALVALPAAGTALPYGLAYASPGPVPLARRVVDALRRVATRMRAVGAGLLGRDAE